MTSSELFAAGTDLLVGLGFTVGIVLTNLPQHIVCWKLRSAQGLSLGYILICTISNVTLALATLMGDFAAIRHAAVNPNVGSWLLRVMQTLNVCIPTFQNGLSVLVGAPSYAIYYFWFSSPQPRHVLYANPTAAGGGSEQLPLLVPSSLPRNHNNDDNANNDNNDSDQDITERTSVTGNDDHDYTDDDGPLLYSDGTEYRTAIFLTAATWVFVYMATIASLYVLHDNSTTLDSYLLEGWGSMAALTNMILYIPQIITTHRSQHEGVLSFASLLIGVVGDVALAMFWVFTAGESVWVYMSLTVDAGMQLILIAMIVQFRKERKERQQQHQTRYALLVEGSTVEDLQRLDRGDEDCDEDICGIGTLFLEIILWFLPSGAEKVAVSPWDGPPSAATSRGWEQLP